MSLDSRLSSKIVGGIFGRRTLGTAVAHQAAFEDCEVIFVTVHESYRAQVPNHKFYVVNDANRWNKLGLVKAALQARLDRLEREA